MVTAKKLAFCVVSGAAIGCAMANNHIANILVSVFGENARKHTNPAKIGVFAGWAVIDTIIYDYIFNKPIEKKSFTEEYLKEKENQNSKRIRQ